MNFNRLDLTVLMNVTKVTNGISTQKIKHVGTV